MPSFRGVSFTYHSAKGQGPHESFAPGASRTVVPVDVAYVEGGASATFGASQEARFEAAVAMLGYQYVATTPSSGKYLTRSTPMPMPQSTMAPLGGVLVPSRPLYASSLSDGVGLGAGVFNAATGGNDYPSYRFMLTGTPRAYRIREDGEVPGEAAVAGVTAGSPTPGYADEGHTLAVYGWDRTRYISKVIRAANRRIGLRPGQFRFVSDGNPITYTPEFLEAISRIRYTWHLVPLAAIPQRAITRTLGHINSYPLDGYETATLLLTHWEYEIQPGPLGDLLATVSYDMLWKPALDTQNGFSRGHNYFPRTMKVTNPSPPPPTIQVFNYDRLTSDGTSAGTPMYLTAPFDALFRPDQ